MMYPNCSKIVVAYDHSELSRKALKMAIDFAKQDDKIELDVVMVLHLEMSEEYPFTYPLAVKAESHREEVQALRKELEQKLMQLPNKTKTLVLEGNPAQIIVEFAKENETDLIVLGSRGLSGLKEIFLGSVSHYVVQKAECPVLVVK